MKTHRDPSTGATVHKAWHDKINTWQCHDGLASTTTDLGGEAEAFYQACYKYGPL